MSSVKKRRKISSKEYLRRKKLLAPIMSFNFKTLKHFTRGQKSAISKAWTKYRAELEHIDNGIATFVKATKAQRKQLKGRFATTNKGIIVYRPESDRKPVIQGKGKDTTVTVELVSRKEIFLPYTPPPDFLTWALQMIEKHKPEWMMLAVGQYKGTQRYDLESAKRYLERDIAPVIAYYETHGKEHPYTGLYMVILKRRKRKQKGK